MEVVTAPATLQHWIGGRADATPADRHGEVTESATGEVIARVPFATPEWWTAPYAGGPRPRDGARAP